MIEIGDSNPCGLDASGKIDAPRDVCLPQRRDSHGTPGRYRKNQSHMANWYATPWVDLHADLLASVKKRQQSYTDLGGLQAINGPGGGLFEFRVFSKGRKPVDSRDVYQFPETRLSGTTKT